MRSRLFRLVGMAALAALIGCFCISDADAAVNKKKKKYLKNVFPTGWQYQAGYTLWRLQRGLDVNPQTWRKYVREKKWRQNRGQENAADKLILKSLDWTVEELATLLKELEDTMTFRPAGVETKY